MGSQVLVPVQAKPATCTRAGQQADEGCCVGGQPAAYFEPEHNQAAAACLLKLGVGLSSFAAGGLGNNDGGMGICISPGLAIPPADERGINCEMLPVPQGQPADNLDAPGVLHEHPSSYQPDAHSWPHVRQPRGITWQLLAQKRWHARQGRRRWRTPLGDR